MKNLHLIWLKFYFLVLSDIHSLVTVYNFLSVFKPDELRQALMPVLEKLYRQDPESLPFRQPVDPVALQIPVKKSKPV